MANFGTFTMKPLDTASPHGVPPYKPAQLAATPATGHTYQEPPYHVSTVLGTTSMRLAWQQFQKFPPNVFNGRTLEGNRF